ncbi:unnamed protein product [Pedinophyceae sp. YPF-701]|nr:unnamed protein product [Pedinophyceae sp. YPF-701]
MPYLSGRALRGLRNYRYKSAGTTWMDELHNPLWNGAVEMLPRWMAPNLITLLGLFSLMIAYSVSSWYLPEMQGVAPTWVYWLSAGCAFFYLHMDCLDGKQARRTGTSSPLGQLFDHGCDALAVYFSLSMAACSISSGHTWVSVGATLGVMVPWVLAHWGEYHTGLMVYGNYLFGITEANYALVAVHTVSATLGPQVWRIEMKDRLGLVRLAQLLGVTPPESADLKTCFLSFAFAICCVIIVAQMANIVLRDDPAAEIPEHERGDKRLGARAAALHLAPLALMFVLGWLYQTAPMDVPGMARTVEATFGVLYALQATRMIMAHMTKQNYAPDWPSLALLGVGVANRYASFMDPMLLAVCLNTLVIGVYLHYVLNVVGEICGELGIQALRIPSEAPKPKPE